jgi:O-antigen ligase
LMLEIGRNQGESSTPLLPVHNVFLYIWAELGVPGLVLFVVACLAILIQVLPRNGLSVFTWGSCFLAMCMVMLFDNYFWAVQPFRDLTFWVIGLWWGYACHLVVPHKAE